MTYLVFKTTCVDREIPLREGAFFFARTMLLPPQDKRNTCDKAKGLRITSERPIGALGARCLSTLNKIAAGLAATGSGASAALKAMYRLRILRVAAGGDRVA